MPGPSSALPTCTEAAGEVLPQRRPRSFRATEPSSRPEHPLWLSAWRPGPRHTEHHRPTQGAADSGSVEQKVPNTPWERPRKSRRFSSKARGLVFLGLPTSRGDTRTTFGSLHHTGQQPPVPGGAHLRAGLSRPPNGPGHRGSGLARHHLCYVP